MTKPKLFVLAFKRIVISLLLGILLICNSACSDRSVSQTKSTVDYSNGKQEVGLLYTKSKKVKSLDNVDDFVSPKKQQELLDPKEVTSAKQPTINRADPKNKLLERTKQMFEDAGNF